MNATMIFKYAQAIGKPPNLNGIAVGRYQRSRAGLLDLCIMPFDPTPTGGYQQTALVRDTPIVTGAREQGLTPDIPLTFNDLDAHRLIIPGRSDPLRQYVEHSLTRRGLRFRLAVETDTLNLCLEFARKGLGLTVLPGCAVQPQWIGEDMGWALREGRRLITTTLAESLSNGRWYGAEPADLSLRGPEI
ncbi:LysR substrate-binding domain-containing protein [Pusillimonas sp. T2]|uniref:LysR substrate-binding domain-containing protein n=1 Tax=Pusillimonas sp. T2 TaxID=1548123 RepID=UPI001303655E|nr:LysR substrate-binding domain-containing protein [Pusillimonas sp. T2]